MDANMAVPVDVVMELTHVRSLTESAEVLTAAIKQSTQVGSHSNPAACGRPK